MGLWGRGQLISFRKVDGEEGGHQALTTERLYPFLKSDD